ncbi:MAG: hypothetical protein CMJ58_05230 [Planctomycetaceae bacterium]|nr:hypothetical protein [Planctomycetaceae bacterium]
MKQNSFRTAHRAFTLVELLVVIAIIGVLVALLLPAIQAAREAARRSTCTNHVKNISIACLNYENAKKEMPYGRKFNYWDAYTWTELILPYIEQQPVYDLFWTLNDPDPVATNGTTATSSSPIGNDDRLRQARTTEIPIYYCPSDGTPIPNEIGTASFGFLRGNYRGCVGAGDMYGFLPAPPSVFSTAMRQLVQSDNNALIGVFGVQVPGTGFTEIKIPANKLAQIGDGTSNTLMISEGVAPTVQNWGGPIGGMIYGNMGGALFSAAESPNTSNPDRIIGPCPQHDLNPPDDGYTQPCDAVGGHPGAGRQGGRSATAFARSLHPGGVVASMADASVHFLTDGTDTEVMRALGTRNLGDISEIQ